jgi:hypothetical protein
LESDEVTVSNPDSKLSYSGTGERVEFPTPYFFANSHIVAIHSDAEGIETTWVENTHYTLTGDGEESGGTLTVEVEPEDYTPLSSERLVIKRVVPYTQSSDYPAGGGFPSNTVEQDFDLAAMRAQQNAEVHGRALLFRDTVDLSTFDPSLPAPDISTPILSVRSDGNGLEWIHDSPGNVVAAEQSAQEAENWAAQAASVVVGALQASNNLDDVSDAATARANLGLHDYGLYDIPFMAGWGRDMTGEDLEVQSYGAIVTARAVNVVGDVGRIEPAAINTGADILLDVEKNGVSIYATPPTITAGTGNYAAGVLTTDPNPVVFTAGDLLEFKVTQIGATIAGQKLTFGLKGYV